MAATRAEDLTASIRRLEQNVIAGGFLQDGCHFDPNLSDSLSPMFSEEEEQPGGGGLYTES